MRDSTTSAQPKSKPMIAGVTVRQLRCLRAPAEVTGTTFATPRMRRSHVTLVGRHWYGGGVPSCARIGDDRALAGSFLTSLPRDRSP
jgi:hypothetical protein